MYSKYHRRFSILFTAFTAVLFILITMAKGITADELADKCQSAENAIRNISMEYEWYQIPPLAHEEQEEPFKSVGVLLPKDGITKYKLTVAPFEDSNGRQKWREVFEETATLTTKDGKSWEHYGKESYDGKVYKKLSTGGWPASIMTGTISSNSACPSVLLTPIGFSFFRFGISEVTKGNKLSTILKNKELVRVTDSASKVNDFNTICVDFLQQYSKLPCIRVFFSVDHNYTPIRYEYLSSGKAGTRINGVIEVHSLEKISEGLWFPTSGTISAPDDKRVNAFQMTGKILVNQGLKEKDFDINFPVGTKVEDQIAGREYTIKEETTK